MKKFLTQIFTLAMLLSATSLMAQDGLFISEVADPGDVYQGRFVELYNSTSAQIDLAAQNYYLVRQANGGNTDSVLLAGTIDAGGTYIIANGEANFTDLYGFAPHQASIIISGNGDDGYFIYQGSGDKVGTLIDIYGEIDVDGTDDPWEYLDSRAVRNVGVTAPNTTWTASEWTIASADLKDFDPGTHDPAGDTDFPTIQNGYPAIDSIVETGFDLVVRINEPGMAYYVVMETGASVPTVSEVKAGTGAGGATAVASGSGNVYITETFLPIEGLTADVTYDVFLVVEDDEGTPNTNPTVVSIQGTPVSPPDVLLNATFETDLTPFTAVDVLGDQGWYQDSYQGNGFAKMSGFASGAQDNTDYLISPAINLDGSTGNAFSFRNATEHSGPALEVFISSDFNGTYDDVNVGNATWTDITSSFAYSEGSYNFVESGEFDLGAYSGTVYIAFKYTSTVADGAPIWEVDDFVVTGYVVQGSDATLSDIKVGEETIADFDAATTEYIVELPAGTNIVPTVTYTKSDENASVVQTDASDLAGDEAARTTTLEVTAEDGTTKKTYTILFNPILEVATLADLRAETDFTRTYTVTGEVVLTQKDGFLNKKYFEDATGAIEIVDEPAVITTVYDIGDGVTGLTGKLNDYYGMLDLKPTADPGAPVSSGNAVDPQVVTVSEFVTNFESYEAEFVKIEGVTFADAGSTFANGKNYAVSVGDDNTVFRTHFYDVISGTIPTMADIQGVAVWDWDEAKVAPRMASDLMAYSSDALLTDLLVDGTTVEGFASGTFDYNVELAADYTGIPDVTYQTSDDNATAVVVDATNLEGSTAERTTEVTVTAVDGTEEVYSIVFTLATTSVQQVEAGLLKIYPVPAQDKLFVEGLDSGSTIEIVNILGSTVRQLSVTKERMNIDVSALDKGIYMILSGEHAVRFIKE
jgi:hypothetical protein